MINPFRLVFDGRPRGKDAVTSTAGAVVGEPTNEGTLFYCARLFMHRQYRRHKLVFWIGCSLC